MKIKGYVNVGKPEDSINIEFDVPDDTKHDEVEQIVQNKILQITNWEWWIDEEEPKYIDATHLKKILRDTMSIVGNDFQKEVLKTAMDIINGEPEAENIGWWRKIQEYGNDAVICECSECGAERIFNRVDGKIKADNYCRDCGASMRIEE